RREFERLLNTAMSLETRGQFNEAREWYRLLRRKGEGTDYADQAADRLARLDGYLQRARELYAAGQQAEESQDFQRCFEIYRELLLDYTRTEQARELRLPIKVHSKPGGASLRVDGVDMGETPVVIFVHPFEPTELELTDSRGHVARQVVEGPLEHDITVVIR
ncbi:MAG: hypothetical protein KDC38_19275, partial [Planctomycetes bacterium]|nr:hypothetical protein [Planctomycetota bacterium]